MARIPMHWTAVQVLLLSLIAASEGVNHLGGPARRGATLRGGLLCSENLFGTDSVTSIRGGAAAALGFPAGYNPFGYGLTDLGKTFLEFDGSLDSDVGRFLSTLKGGKRKTLAVMKDQWLEVVRVSKQGQSMRIYRKLDDMVDFCLKAGFID